MSSTIQLAQSAPDYITQFINGNLLKLNKIYEEGLELWGSGCLVFVCSQEINKMDVQFMGDTQMSDILQKDSWVSLYNGIPTGKKLFFVRDEDRNDVFLIYL